MQVKNIIVYILLLLLAAELVALGVIRSQKTKTAVLSLSIEPSPTSTPVETPEPTPIPTPTPTNSPKPTVTPTVKSTPTPVPQPVFSSQEINGFVDRFASQYGVNADVLRHVALCESGFNPLAMNLGYAGLYQFGSTTWKNIRNSFGEDPNPDLRLNAEEAVQTAAYAISIGKGGLWPNCMP
jgi:hypothetical protein